MSEKNGKVCCNCVHNIRVRKNGNIECHCNAKDNKWLSYLDVMTGWCNKWTGDRFEQIRRLRNENRR